MLTRQPWHDQDHLVSAPPVEVEMKWAEGFEQFWTNKSIHIYIWYSITRYNKYMWWKLCSCFESADTAKSAMLPPWPCQVKTTQERIDGRSSPLWSGWRCGWCKDKHHISSHSKYVIWWKVCTCKLDILPSIYHYTMSSGDPFGGWWHAVTCYPCESIWGIVWYLLAHSCQKPRSRGFCRNSKLEALEAREN